MTDHRFDLVGGDAALDFLNTIHDWTVEEPRDHLPDFAAALRFGTAAGVLTRAEARQLAGGRAQGDTREMRALRVLRARLERIFRAAVAGRPPAPGDLAALERETAAAARVARLRPARGRIERAIDAEAAGAALLRARVAEAAAALLTSPRMERVKACPGCGWYFLDASKNRSRRWCSMETCGSSAKARRYYWRSRGRAAGTRASAGRS